MVMIMTHISFMCLFGSNVARVCVCLCCVCVFINCSLQIICSNHIVCVVVRQIRLVLEKVFLKTGMV